MFSSVAIAITPLLSRTIMGGLLNWYDNHARPLPWRIEEVSPWETLLAEIIMQQTRMETGLPYWERIRAAYPTPQSLAQDSEENLMLLWQGCGYYARARNLYKLAVALGENDLPREYGELLKLPGIGPYTAAAISSICHNEPVACVDGNIRRVLSRFHATDLSPSQLNSKATEKLDTTRPGDWNQAMMELGSQVCTPRNPNCTECPMNSTCVGMTSGNPEIWPVKKKKKQKSVSLVALIIHNLEGVHLIERTGKTLGGLRGIPLAEVGIESDDLLSGRDVTHIGKIKHDFTHRKLLVDVYSTSPRSGEVVIDPETAPLSSLDRKILSLVDAV